ncbi:MAG: hypothetical protein V4621_01250 [Pseudomonadota bacterium]
MRLPNIALLTGVLVLLAACCTPNLASGASLSGKQDLKQRQSTARQASAVWEKQSASWKKKLDDTQQAQMTLLVAMAANHHETRQMLTIMDGSHKSCAKANPQLAKGMNAAWKGWDQGTKKALSDSETRLDVVLDHQTAGPRKEVVKYLQTYRRAAESRAGLVQMIPVTSERDCMKLQRTLGDGGEKIGNKLTISTRAIEEALKDILSGKTTFKQPTGGND